MTVDKKIKALRALMAQHAIDAWIVGGSDPHSSEYVASRYLTRHFISGFSGSAGTVVITQAEALLWVDSRYYLQAEQEVMNSEFKVQKLDYPGFVDHQRWLCNNSKKGWRVGFDALTMTVSAARNLKSLLKNKGVEVIGTEDWFDLLWSDRPPLPLSPVSLVELKYAGLSAQEKIESVRQASRQQGAEYTLISSLDDIAWLFNLRGSDIPYNPLFLAYALIEPERALLFTSDQRFGEVEHAYITQFAHLKPYEEVFSYVAQLRETSLYLSPEKTSLRLYEELDQSLSIIEGRDVTTDLKGVKNSSELEGMRQAHLYDGIAMVKFLAHLEEHPNYRYDEVTLAEVLEEKRRESPYFIGPSFATISGFAANGAIVHYRALPESAAKISGDGLLVLDSGGQYSCGTTDITRTLLFGEATEQMRHDYTLVLKGNLALAAQRFPEGTNGYQLDILARQYLWQEGLTYGHGTGHGLGFYLNVHEGPQNISPKPLAVPLQAGMVLSNEPGLYRTGEYGIRIENILAVTSDGSTDFGKFYSFEVLTLAPFERKLIDVALLTAEEREIVDSYHAWVYEELYRYLDEGEQAYLQKSCAPL